VQERETRLLQENNQLRRFIESSNTEELKAMLEASQAQVISLQRQVVTVPDQAGFATVLPDLQEQLWRFAEDNEAKQDRITRLEGELSDTRNALNKAPASAQVTTAPYIEIDSREVKALTELEGNATQSAYQRTSKPVPRSPDSPQKENEPPKQHQSDCDSSYDAIEAQLLSMQPPHNHSDCAVNKLFVAKTEATAARPARPLTPMPQAKRMPLGTHKRLPRPAHAKKHAAYSKRPLPDTIPARIVATLS